MSDLPTWVMLGFVPIHERSKEM